MNTCPICGERAEAGHEHGVWSEDCVRCDGTGCGACQGSEAAARARAERARVRLWAAEDSDYGLLGLRGWR